MTKLVILNLYGTILPSDGSSIVRQGFFRFMEKYRNKNFLISARSSKEEAIKDLELADFVGYELHTLEDMVKYITYEDTPERLSQEQRLKYAAEVVSEGRTPEYFIARPYVERIAREKQMKLNDMLLISHHPEDVELANTYFPRYGRIKVIQVPEFEDKNDVFSFERVSIDSCKNWMRFALQSFIGTPYLINIK